MSTERSASGRGTSLRVRMCAVKKDHVISFCVEQMAGLVQKGQEFILGGRGAPKSILYKPLCNPRESCIPPHTQTDLYGEKC